MGLSEEEAEAGVRVEVHVLGGGHVSFLGSEDTEVEPVSEDTDSDDDVDFEFGGSTSVDEGAADSRGGLQLVSRSAVGEHSVEFLCLWDGRSFTGVLLMLPRAQHMFGRDCISK